MSAGIAIASRTLAGAARPHVQDVVVVDHQACLAVIADGMGAAGGGEVAAALTAHELVRLLRITPVADLRHRLTDIFAVVSRAVERRAAGEPSLAGMSATALVATVDLNHVAHVAHVGAARAFLVRTASPSPLPPSPTPHYCPPVSLDAGTRLVCLTRDHTSLCDAVERGQVKMDALHLAPPSHLTRALGTELPSLPDYHTVQLRPGDRLVLTTDGLWGMLAPESVAAIVHQAADPEAGCAELVAASQRLGAHDDVSAVWFDLPSERARADHAPPRPRPPPPPRRSTAGHPGSGDLARGAPPPARELDPPAPPPSSHPPAARPSSPWSEEASPPSSLTTSVIEELGRDITALARQERLDPVIGRRAEIKELAQIMVRRGRRSNALLVGDVGVGRTTVVEGLARRMVASNAPDWVQRKRVVQLSIASLISGSRYHHDVERQLEEAVRAAQGDLDLMLFIDQIHVALGSHTPDAPPHVGAVLKQAIARGDVHVIGATTPDVYEQMLAHDPLIARNFEVLSIAEPSRDDTLLILEGLRPRFETHYKVTVQRDALAAAVDLSIRYVPQRRLPDKAVELVDQACSRAMLHTFSDVENASLVSRSDIISLVAHRYQVTVEEAEDEEDARGRIKELYDYLAERLFGQEEAIGRVAVAIEKAYASAAQRRGPAASLVLVGPSGTGKAETARVVAEFLFGDREDLVRLDLSQHADSHAVGRLIGTSEHQQLHHDEGELTAAVRHKSAQVVLLQHVERAHPAVHQLLWQVLEAGELTDAAGRLVSFRDALVIMTSRVSLDDDVGADHTPILGSPGVPAQRAASDIQARAGSKGRPKIEPQELRRRMGAHLPAEITRAVSEVVRYRPLDEAARTAIVSKVTHELLARLRAHGSRVRLPPRFVSTMVETIGAPRHGAHEIARRVGDAIAGLMEAAVSQPPAAGGPSSVMFNTMRARSRGEMALVSLRVVDASTVGPPSHPNAQLASYVAQLTAQVRTHPSCAHMTYLECTADGLYALCDSTAAALELARASFSAPLHGRRFDSFGVRRVVHAGHVSFTDNGRPVGVELHRLHRVSEATEGDRTVDQPIELPAERLVSHGDAIVTGQARAHLPEHLRGGLSWVGAVRLAGYEQPVELWLAEQIADDPSIDGT